MVILNRKLSNQVQNDQNYQKLSSSQHHNKKKYFAEQGPASKPIKPMMFSNENPIPKKILVDTPLLFPFYEGYKKFPNYL